MGITLFQPPLLMLALIVLLLATWTREGTTWTSTWQELQSTWSGFLDNFEVRDGMTEVARREFRDQANQISRPRIEGAESSRPSRETTNLEQPGPRIFTAATPTGRLAATSMRMSPPTTTAQPHWTTPTRPTPKGKELENKLVQDQTVKDFQEKDMRDHWSGYNDEDEDQLKLDIERIDGEEGQDPNKETGQNDLPNQVSRISNNQVPGVETQHQHDDGHCQAYGRDDQEPGVDHQISTFRILDNNQVSGVEPQFSTNRVPGNNHSAGVEAQQPASGDGPDNCQSQVCGRQWQVPGVESQVPTTIRSANKQVPQVSTPRELDHQDTGLEAQFPAYGKLHKQADEEEHDVHNQAYRRDSNQEAGLKTQNSTEEKHHNQGQHNQGLGVELQMESSRGPHYQVTEREVQDSSPVDSRDQHPYCLTHSHKSNIAFTERVLLRNSSKDQDNTERMLLTNSSKDQDKPGKLDRILEVMNWWRAVCELLVLATAFHVSMDLGFLYSPIRKLQQQFGFHNKSPKGLKISQTSLGERVQQQAGEEIKKDIWGKPRKTGRVSCVKTLLILLVVWFETSTKEATSNSNRVHLFTSPDEQRMITMEPKIVYRRSGENLAFLNDCLATQLEAIIKELERGSQSDPKFWSLINNQRRPQNKVVIGKLKTRECSDPRTSTLPRNGKELQKGGRSSPKFLYSLQHRRGFKNETINEELERRGRSHSRVWILKTDQKELRNQISWELEKSSHNNPKLLDLIRIQKRSKNEVPKKELKEEGHDHQKFWISKRHQEELWNMNSLELKRGCLSDHEFLDLMKNKKRSKNEMINREEGLSHHRFWITKRDQVEFQNKTSWELKGKGYKSNEFWIHKKFQKKPQNTNRLGLQEGCLNHHGFLDFLKNTKKSSRQRARRKGLEKPGHQCIVQYPLYCTVP